MTSTDSPISSTRSAPPRRRPERLVLVLALALAAPSLVATARADGLSALQPPPSPDAVARALDDVLADPVLREGLGTSHVDAAAAGDVLAEGSRHLWGAFRRWSFRLAREHPVLFYSASLAMLLALVPLLVHIGWSLTLAFRGSRAGPPGAAEVDDPAARRRRSAELRAEARDHAAAGRPREAARALLLAFLALLAERRALAVAGSWTNREVLAHLRVPPPERERLAHFVEAADAACYGDHGPSRDALAAGEALLADLERDLERAPGGRA